MSLRMVLYEVDDSTGEIHEINPEEYVIYPASIVDAQAEYKRKMYARNASGYSDRFVWATYELLAPWFSEVSHSDIVRMVFLATYISYNGYLSGGNHRALNVKDVKRLIGLSDRRFYDFWSTTTKAHLLCEKDGKIYADSKVFRKGELRPAVVSKYAEKGVYFTRLYADAVRQLYRAVPASFVRVASYIFQVMPFVNREFNIVCHNPLETDLEKVQPLKLSEFCELVGYNKRGSRRLLGQLAGMRITVDGEEQSAVSYEKYPARQLTYGIFINPNIYYAGSDILAVELMGAFRRRDRIPERKEG